MAEGQKNPPGAGKSSFELIDPENLFAELHLSSRMVFLDLGCGKGAYSIAVSERIGKDGLVHAVDLWEEGISSLQDRIAKEGYANIKAVVADVGTRIPIEDGSVDVCLLATVLHELVEIGAEHGALNEAARVMKPGATLAIIEFKMIDGPPGPPKKARLDPDAVEKIVVPHGFARRSLADLGPYNYLSLFEKTIESHRR
jgi:ubiquinone/menaquinone biosynthesis C-methylase UbiE